MKSNGAKAMVSNLATKSQFTYEDYLHWPEGQRWELIYGKPYAMAPAPARVHQETVLGIASQLFTQLYNKPCRPYIALFDVRLPQSEQKDEAINTVVQPDIVVVCDESKLDERGCRGAPDWIIEVLSPNTAVHDQIDKRDLYERHGVLEYWLVHPSDRILTIYCLDGDGYAAPRILATEGVASSCVLPELSIDWARVFPPPEQSTLEPPHAG